MDGKVLTFHLAGINNQNFLMRDEETGSFWQQISGKAISGPMRGRQLELVHSDELSFGLWRKEYPQGSVLLPVPQFEKSYETKEWEKRIGKAPTVVDTSKSGIAPRETMFGVELNGANKAYRSSTVMTERLIQDRVGGTPIIIVVGPDQLSVRAFIAAKSSELPPDFYRKPESPSDSLFIDSATGSEWNFKGCAIHGPAQGRCLEPVEIIKDYWFDWQIYHPKTAVFRR